MDRWRIVAFKRVARRNAVNDRFPELAAAVAKLRPDVLVLDGVMAVFDEPLVSRFHLLGEPDPAVQLAVQEALPTDSRQ